MDQSTKKTVKVKIRQPDLRSLLDLSNKMPSGRRDSFPNKYGNILSLLKINVQTEALTALAQFYDPLLRCFTFQDYQLAPTLEEFEQILQFPADNNKPYRYVENYSLAKNLASILKVKVSDLAKEIVVREKMKGLPREYLEEIALILAGKNDWVAFGDVLALLIYGIVLFPCVPDFIDYTAIDVFLAFKTRGQNPTSVILADIYYALHDRHDKKEGVLLCCLHVLYCWFTSHIFKGNYHIETKGKAEWKQYITGLRGSDITWCSLARDISEVVYQCDGFPNVPLIGTKGCINYNPALALRQLGYPMMHPPPTESLASFVLYKRGSEDLNMLRRISRSWDRVIKKGRIELGRRGTNAGENYLQWVRLRAQEVKLPFRLALPIEPEVPEPAPIPNEEVEELKNTLARSEQEKVELRAQLERVLQEKRSLQQENALKEKSLAEYDEKMSISNKKLTDVQGCLKSANDEIKVRNRDRDKAIDRAYACEARLNKSRAAEKDLRGQLERMKSQLEGLVAEYEGKLMIERKAKGVVLERLEECQAALQNEFKNASERKVFADYQEMLYKEAEEKIAHLKDEYVKLDDHCTYWKDKFSCLAGLGNEAIREVPERLKAVDAVMTRDNTPIEVFRFVNFCKCLIVMLEIRARLPEDRKRKRA